MLTQRRGRVIGRTEKEGGEGGREGGGREGGDCTCNSSVSINTPSCSGKWSNSAVAASKEGLKRGRKGGREGGREGGG